MLAQKAITIQGRVKNIRFRNDQTGWTVFTVEDENGMIHSVNGETSASEGMVVRCTGVWEPRIVGGVKYLNFKASTIVASTPKSELGMAKYLAAILKGVGDRTALRMVKHFGMDNIEHILDHQPERLTEMPGIGKGKAQNIVKSWRSETAVRKLIEFFAGLDVTPALCRRIYQTYGNESIDVISQNPYRLCHEVRGIGFKTADELALKLQIPRTSPYRVKAGLEYVMGQFASQGHCGAPVDDFVQAAVEFLQVPRDLVERQVAALSEGKFPLFHIEDDMIWSARLAQAENIIARRFRELAARKPVWWSEHMNIDEMLEKAQRHAGITLANAQKDAVKMALSNGFSVITGGPGCGKTTTLNVLLNILGMLRATVTVAAPTGKAAQRAAEATGIQASTLHRALGIKPSERDDGDKDETPIKSDLLVVDESSMIDVPLMARVVSSIAPNTSILLVGDIDQLPSVGAGFVLGDTIGSGVVPVTRLTRVYRQGKDSLISSAAHAVNAGKMPEIYNQADGDFFVLTEDNAASLRNIVDTVQPEELPGVYSQVLCDMIVDMVVRRLPRKYGFDPVKDIMVLAPARTGACGVNALNSAIQKAVHGERKRKTRRINGQIIGVGDKVLQTRNDYDLDICNGDSGVVTDIDEENELIVVNFDGRGIEIPFESADNLVLAYAMTIHKSQGSEAPAVVIPMTTQHWIMLQRNLLYTGITRAKKLCVVMGMHRAIRQAVRNKRMIQRHTRLRHLLNTAA